MLGNLQVRFGGGWLEKQVMLLAGHLPYNPGPGGYAAILQAGSHEKVLTGGAVHTTNKRMELQAVIAGLAALKRCCQVTVVTDSQYVATVLKACTEHGRNGGKVKANHDLVQQLRTLTAQHTLLVQVIAGHSGHKLNERCDRLAQTAARQNLSRPCDSPTSKPHFW